MADLEARIRDLANRVEREPGSRFFVPLAEEYRKAGRLADAIATLEKGLGIHAGYVAARIALARTYLEAGRIEESMASFSKALAEDPSNLVAAKALGDLHLSRGEPLEALKRYLRYRGISGDRRLDAVIARLEAETAPPKEVGDDSALPPPPPPPSFRPTPVGAPAPVKIPDALANTEGDVTKKPARKTDPFDISGIPYKRPSATVTPEPSKAPDVPSRDVSLDSFDSRRAAGDEEIVTRKIRLPPSMWPFESSHASAEPPPAAPSGPADSGREQADVVQTPAPPGRTLADLFFEQGHYAEALRLYQDLLTAHPSDQELRRLHDEASKLAAGPSPRLPAGDPARARRLAKIRILNEWLTVIQTSARHPNGRLRRDSAPPR
jgi:tetratricopeptide (TPR) repeat protein